MHSVKTKAEFKALYKPRLTSHSQTRDIQTPSNSVPSPSYTLEQLLSSQRRLIT